MKHHVIFILVLDESLKKVGEGYKTGHVTKDEYANKDTQRMKSEQRTKAATVIARGEKKRRAESS